MPPGSTRSTDESLAAADGFGGERSPLMVEGGPGNPISAPATPSAEDLAMAHLMHACWASFAKTGTPRCGGYAWPRYDPQTDQLLEFGSPSRVQTHFRKMAYDKAQKAQPGAR